MPSVVDVIINSDSGSTGEDTADELTKFFKARDIQVRIHPFGENDDLDAVIAKAIEGDGDVTVACGGDGTVSAVAAAAVAKDRVLGVLPLGTLNNFSKDLEIPQTLEEAVEVIAAGQTAVIDVAEVNGQIFINNSSIGLYSQIVRRREKQQQLGRGKWSAAFWAALKVVRFSSFLKVRIIVDEKEIVRRTPFVFVGNNDYEMEIYNIGRRPRLDEGKLSIYFLRRGTRWGVIVMLLRTFVGAVKQWSDFEEVQTDSVTIVSRKKRLLVAHDGEVTTMDTPLEYRIIPGALKVIIPTPAAGAAPLTDG